VEANKISSKSRLIALLLCLFFGWLGVHRFYVGKIGTGILMICTFGGFFGIWILIDLILIILGSFSDKDGKAVFKWLESGSI
jgi:TM2 domain-containing membrane protein YozV